MNDFMPLWRPDEFMEALAPVLIDAGAPPPVTGVSIDSRTIEPGDAYFAIKGDRFDGHRFAEAAIEDGAACAVVSRAIGDGRGQIVVTDVLEAMRCLARAARARMTGRVIGVTGSVGKTSTKEMLRTLLAPFGAVHAASASFNNHWGVPLTLARMPRDADFAVCEIGMNHAGEIIPLTAMVRPHVAIVTTVEAVHIEFFDGVEAIADAKAEIFTGLESGGTAVLNADNPHFARLRAAAEANGAGRIITFGRGAEVDARLRAATPTRTGARLEAEIDGHAIDAAFGLRGDHMAMNAVAALGAMSACGVPPGDAAPGLADVKPAPGRGERVEVAIEGGSVLLIDESYNANPSSVRAALSVLETEAGRRIAVLGDMLELGEDGPALHAGLAFAVRAGADRAYLCGPLMRALHEALPESVWAPDAASLADRVSAALAPGDVVMVKGSLGSRMGPIADALRALGD